MKSTIKTQSQSAVLILIAGLSSFGLAITSGAAHAANSQQPLSRKVSYGDLNLDSTEGAKVLYARLRGAANDVCRPFEGRELILQRTWQTCFNDAVARAVAQVNKSTVTALHNQATNRPTAPRAS